MLLDATFDYTWDDANDSKPSKSHYYVNEENFLNEARPKNWQSPVDYRNGVVHVRTEVFQKPAGDQKVGWTLCYIANEGEYGCTGSKYYESTGVFENEQKMTDFWQNETIEWDKGIKQMDLVYTINDSGSGHVHYFPELKDKTTPTRVRITLVQVSAGSRYDPSILDAAGGTSGAGGSPSGGADQGGGVASGGAAGTVGTLGGAGGMSGGGSGALLNAGAGGTVPSSGGSSLSGASGAPAAGMASSAGSVSTTPAVALEPKGDAGCAMSRLASRSSWNALCVAFAGLALARRTRRFRPR
ncbi:MAG: hypothetical protein K0R38_4062 [Polyangiaceae bacterium]|nr:hypothetical protein [Polyangiaceae bacterium]